MEDETACKWIDAIGHRYGRRPSEIMGVKNTWAAYQFDRAVVSVVFNDKEENKPAQTSTEQDWMALAGTRGINIDLNKPQPS